MLATVTAMLLLATGAASATTAPQQGPPAPPPVGAEIPLPLAVEALTLTVNGLPVTTGPLTGEVIFRVEASDPLNPWSLRLKVIGLSLTTAIPPAPADAERQRQGFGNIGIEQSDSETTPDSLVNMASQSPPRWEQTMFLDFTMTIENPPEGMGAEAGTEQAREPLVLATKEPGKLIGQLSSFPPKGEVYQLQNPIELVLPDKPEETVASIDTFPVKVGGL